MYPRSSPPGGAPWVAASRPSSTAAAPGTPSMSIGAMTARTYTKASPSHRHISLPATYTRTKWPLHPRSLAMPPRLNGSVPTSSTQTAVVAAAHHRATRACAQPPGSELRCWLTSSTFWLPAEQRCDGASFRLGQCTPGMWRAFTTVAETRHFGSEGGGRGERRRAAGGVTAPAGLGLSSEQNNATWGDGAWAARRRES